MNKDNAMGFVPLLVALSQGKTIQLLKANVGGKSEWVDMGPDCVTFGFYDLAYYRVKTEPKETYHVFNRSGIRVRVEDNLNAVARALANEPGGYYEKYVQVL